MAVLSRRPAILGSGAVAAVAIVVALVWYPGVGSAPANMSVPSDSEIETTQTKAAAPPVQELTGNLTVYIIATPEEIDARKAIPNIIDILPFYETMKRSEYGASPKGQYTDRVVEITWDDDIDGFAKGDKVIRTVFEKGPETVKFYIDPEVKKPDGSPVTRDDFREDYGFGGGGISCCGVDLRKDDLVNAANQDGTSVNAVVIVVDQAYDSQMMEALSDIKVALQNTPKYTLEDWLRERG